MKRYLERFRQGALFCLILLVLTAGTAVPASASKYMEGRSADFSIYLDEEGGATITEEWECYFGGDTITRYRRHYSNPDPDACEITVEDVRMDGESMDLLDAPDESRPEGSAAVYGDDEGGVHVEMYLDALDETHTFTIEYYVSNAVILYNDTAEFHYTLTSENEAFDIDVLEAVIELPAEVEYHGLYFWAHAPEEYTSFDALETDGMTDTFFLHTEEILSDSPVTVRFAMPPELFPDSTRTLSLDMLDSILEEEHALRDDEPEEEVEDDSYEENDGVEEPGFLYDLWYTVSGFGFRFMQLWFRIAIFISVAPFLILMLFSRRVKRYAREKVLPGCYARRRLKPTTAPLYCTTIPDNMKPAMVRKLMAVYPGERDVFSQGNTFSATLLDLVESGLIESGRNEAGELTYQVSPKASTANITEYEFILLEILSTAGASRAPMTTGEITDYMRNNYSWCKKEYRAFDRAVDTAFEAAGLTVTEQGARKSDQERLRFIVIYGLLIFAGTYHYWGLLEGLGAAVAMTILGYLGISGLWSLLHPDFTVLTQEGEDRYARWKGYSNYLRDCTNDQERAPEDLKVWRKYLVYAVALGCGTQLIDDLRISLPAVYDSFRNDDYLWGYEDMYRSASDIDREGGFIRGGSSDSSGDSGLSESDSYDSGDWGGCSDSGGDSDSGSSGSDFD